MPDLDLDPDLESYLTRELSSPLHPLTIKPLLTQINPIQAALNTTFLSMLSQTHPCTNTPLYYIGYWVHQVWAVPFHNFTGSLGHVPNKQKRPGKKPTQTKYHPTHHAYPFPNHNICYHGIHQFLIQELKRLLPWSHHKPLLTQPLANWKRSPSTRTNFCTNYPKSPPIRKMRFANCFWPATTHTH